MCKFLSKIRHMDPTIKKLIVIVCILFCGPIPLLIYYLLKKIYGGNKKTFTTEIDYFKSVYGFLRKYVEQSNESVITIGSYACEYEGKLFLGSNFISIYAKNLPDSILKDCAFIESKTIENDTYFQFPIKLRYSKREKRTIIRAVLDYIHANYPNDKVFFDKDVPFGAAAVGLNPIIDFFQEIDEATGK